MRNNQLKGLSVTAAIGLIAVGTALAHAQQAPPPRPAWVDEQGKVKLDSAPREVPMVGPDGKYLKDEKGANKMVPTYIGATPAPPLR
jgi:hypothetical protein